MTKNKPVKARLLWAYQWHDGILEIKDTDSFQKWAKIHPTTGDPQIGHLKVAVLDVSDENALVEQITDVLCTSPCGKTDQAPHWFRENKRKEARAVLESLGLLRPSKRNRKGKGSA